MIDDYYSRVNSDLLSRTPLNSRVVIEIGCGAGSFAAAYLSLNPQARYIGVEVHGPSVDEARSRCSAVIHGDIESQSTYIELDRLLDGDLADVVIFGDVLEHLRDPWGVLRALKTRVRDGGTCIACIPNVAHWTILQQQMCGNWNYEESGLLDRTHLRFFTRRSAESMLLSAGWNVVDATPRILWPEKADQAAKMLEQVARSFGASDESFKADVTTFQWIIRSVSGQSPTLLTVAGLGLRKVAGVTEARVDYPLYALRSRPGLRVLWSSDGLSIPRDLDPGILILQRRFLDSPKEVELVEALTRSGWLLVSDIDDDPSHWGQYRDSGFRAFRGVHAVSVSTEALASVVKQWNPTVAVFPNEIFQVRPYSSSVPKSGKVSIFFGAINRQADWAEIREAIYNVAQELKSEVKWVVVHDKEFFDNLPDDVIKEFHATLSHPEYMRILSGCDISLLPLLDTPFNQLKSDLKFIECCAVGTVPICSPVIYGVRTEHRRIGFFADHPNLWVNSIVNLARNHSDLAIRRKLGHDYVRTNRMHGQSSVFREMVYRDWFSKRHDLEIQRRQRLSVI